VKIPSKSDATAAFESVYRRFFKYRYINYEYAYKYLIVKIFLTRIVCPRFTISGFVLISPRTSFHEK
jgi:hypothetical protein